MIFDLRIQCHQTENGFKALKTNILEILSGVENMHTCLHSETSTGEEYDYQFIDTEDVYDENVYNEPRMLIKEYNPFVSG